MRILIWVRTVETIDTHFPLTMVIVLEIIDIIIIPFFANFYHKAFSPFLSSY